MEHQRKLHEEERALWNTERQELHQTIQNLEATVRQLKSLSDPELQSPSALPQARGVVPGSFPTSKRSSRTTSMESNRDGPPPSHGAVHAPRSQSDASVTASGASSSVSKQLPSISEEQRLPGRKKSVGFTVAQGSPPADAGAAKPPVAPIPGERIHHSFDGINFRPPGSLSLPTLHGSLRSPHKSPPLSGEISPSQKPSVPEVKPRPQLLDLPASNLSPGELLTKDAGHTPLARALSDGSAGSAAGTPTAATAREAPFAPRPSVAPPLRPPAERSDSYFPEPDPDAKPDPDPELKGPLGLVGDAGSTGNKTFLTELDSKLLRAQTESAIEDSPELSPTKAPRGANGHGKSTAGGDEPAEDEDDGGPKLRIKRSLNFGSVFGSSRIGHGA